MVHFYTYIRGLFNRARNCQNSLYLQHKFWQALASARSVEQASDVKYINIDVFLSDVMTVDVLSFSGEGSRHSDNSEDRTPSAMARAVTVHPDTTKVMYFA